MLIYNNDQFNNHIGGYLDDLTYRAEISVLLWMTRQKIEGRRVGGFSSGSSQGD